MEFTNKAQQDCYEKVVPWMKEIFGEFVRVREDAPLLSVVIGSAVVQIGVFPWGEDDVTVVARSYVVTGVEMTLELAQFLLKENSEMRFGAFGIDSDGDVTFQHSIVGSQLQKEELKATVMAVVWTADEYDDKIVAKWGGQRAVDRR